MGTRVVAIVAAVMVTGCSPRNEAFSCTGDASCGAGGKCEPVFNLCSFADPKCGPDGRSFGDLGGPNSGRCVGSVPPPDGGMPDSPPDARVCFGTSLLNNFNVCLETAPTMSRTFAASTAINTDDPQMCDMVKSGGTGLCVIAAASISVEATLRATGLKPLVLIARDTITVTTAGVIDVASRRGANPEIGAGGDPATCADGMLPMSANNTNGGGAGGSFAGLGGTGGNGGGNVSNPGGAGGTPAAPVLLINQLRGGCAGQEGKGGGASKGLAGHGGGAVLLIAGGSISVAGAIHASGEGGAGGLSGEAGGGGGGAGGMIVLEAPSITSTGLILANGGGGGEGSGTSATGNAGADPTAITAASGGNDKTMGGGSPSGGDGGDGSAGATSQGTMGMDGAGPNSGGGGGGGGGAGVIKVPPIGVNLGSNVSPSATQ